MTRPPRLLMVVHGPYPRMEPRVEREAAAARAAGWDVDVLAVLRDDEPATETTAAGVRVFRVPLAQRERGSALNVIREYLGFTLLAIRRVAALDRTNRYTVVQIHNPPDFLLLAGVVPRLRGARLVFDVHDFAPELFELRLGHRLIGRIAVPVLGLVERLALRAADAIVTVHEPYRRAIAARGVPAEKVTVALNTPDEEFLPEEPPATPNAEAYRVVYHGTITAHYGLETLVDAIGVLRGEIPNLLVEIYGGGDAIGAVERRVDELSLRDIFRFSDGFLDARTVLSKVAGADVGVIANLPLARNHAAIPTKLFEYAAIGVPVVSSDLRGVREYFGDDEVRFFAGGDPTALADAISALARDRAAASEQAARAHRRYAAYRWSSSAQEYVEMLDRLARDARHR